MRPSKTRRWIAIGVLGVVGLADAALLLWPNGGPVHQMNLNIYLYFLKRGMPRTVVPETYADVLNVALLIPVGWAIATLAPRVSWWKLALAGLAAVVLIELYQDLSAIERVTSVLDVLLNTSGFLAGVGLARLGARSRLDENPRLNQ